MIFCGHMFLTERQTLEFEVHGRDSFGNECFLDPESVSLQSVPEAALSADTRVTPGSSPSVVIVTATVLRPGEHPGTWLESHTDLHYYVKDLEVLFVCFLCQMSPT